jgi:hypothetical protein
MAIFNSFKGTAAPNATVFVFEGIGLDKMVAQGATDGVGTFSFSAQPAVSFVDSKTGQPKSQAFVSYRILAFWINEAGNAETIQQFKSVRFLPGDAAKAEAWSFLLSPVRSGPDEATPTPLGEVTPDNRADPFCIVPCIYQSEDLGSHLTKVGEVHTTAGASSTFEFGISSAVTIEVAASYDNFVTFSLSGGVTWSEGLGGIWKRAESDINGIEALSSFQYERRWWHLDYCKDWPRCEYCIIFPFLCSEFWWQTVEPVKFNGGAKEGPSVVGDNLQAERIPSKWRKSWTSPGNSWFRTVENSWYLAASVGLKVEVAEVSLGLRIEASEDTKYTAEFDPETQYDYEEMIAYDGGTDGATWYFTHRLAKETLAATDETSNAVKLQWSRFGGLDFARYEIWFKRKSQSTWSLHSAITDREQLSGWFDRLSSGTTYQFYVSVKEKSGLYRDTDVVERRTDGGGGGGGCPRCPPPSPI